MRYIKIKNNGIIEPEALHLVFFVYLLCFFTYENIKNNPIINIANMQHSVASGEAFVGDGCFFMKEIKLTQGRIALVDNEDYEYLNQFKWIASKASTTQMFYACRWATIAPNTRMKIVMHRLLLNITDGNIFCDHIDGNTLNNQKSNLRKCTISENNKNRRSKKGGASKYLGVSVMTSKKKRKNTIEKWIGKPKYVARIRCDNKEHYLGSFPYTQEGEILAAKAYDNAAKELHGEFANLNFKTINT